MDASTVTSVAVATAVVCWVLFYWIPVLRRDAFRADIRAIRNEVFDFMVRHSYSFECASYRRTRDILNGMLALSNQIGPFSFLFVLAAAPLVSSGSIVGDDVDDTMRAFLEDSIRRAVNRMFRFLYSQHILGMCIELMAFVLVHSSRRAKIIASHRAEHAIGAAMAAS